jgi:hypothetical protein
MEQTELDSRAASHLAQTKRIAKSNGKDLDELLGEYHEDFTERDQRTADELAVSTRALELRAEESA